MERLFRTALRVTAAVVLYGCASGGSTVSSGKSTAADSIPRVDDRITVDRETTTTGAIVSAMPQWTDAQILTVINAANAADREEAEEAQARSHDPRVMRLVRHLEMDDRGLGARARDIAGRMGTADSAERLEIDVERGGFLMKMREAPPESFDAIFMTAQLKQSKALVQLIDEVLLPAAQTDEVRSLLTEMRAGAALHSSIAESALKALEAHKSVSSHAH
jgi:predicted outer membrane protein